MHVFFRLVNIGVSCSKVSFTSSSDSAFDPFWYNLSCGHVIEDLSPDEGTSTSW